MDSWIHEVGGSFLAFCWIVSVGLQTGINVNHNGVTAPEETVSRSVYELLVKDFKLVPRLGTTKPSLPGL